MQTSDDTLWLAKEDSSCVC